MVNFKFFLFLIIITLLFQCSTNKPNNDINECTYNIQSITDLNPNLTTEIEAYLKNLFNSEHFLVKDEYLIIWVKSDDEHIIYSIAYDVNIDEHRIDFTNSIFHFDNKILIFLNDGGINQFKKFRMNRCKIETILKDKFPYFFEHFKKYNIWPIGANLENIPVYELIFNKQDVLINKRIYFE